MLGKLKREIWQQMTTREHAPPPQSPDLATNVTARPQRRCLVTGESYDCDQLVRFVVAPDDQLTPDLKMSLPGRGLWVRATHSAITQAAGGKLFARAARQNVSVPTDLADRVHDLFIKQVSNGLGLVRKAGKIVLGYAKVHAALERQNAYLLMHAIDGSADECAKLDRLAQHLAIEMRRVLTIDQQSAALGQDNIVHMAITDRQWAYRLAQMADRILGYGFPLEVRRI